MNKNIVIGFAVVLLGITGYYFATRNSVPAVQNTAQTGVPVVEEVNTSSSETVQTEAQPDARASGPSETTNPKPTPTQTSGNTQKPGTYTLAQVATHKDATSCYSVVRGEVYDLTSWIQKHPGGPQRILSMCGKDATSAFERKHGGQPRPENELDGYKIGTLVQ